MNINIEQLIDPCKRDPFTVRDIDGEQNVVVACPWRNEFFGQVDPERVRFVSIGSRVDNLDFLKNFKFVTTLSLYYEYVDIESICELKNVRTLRIWHSKGPKIRFAEFPALQSCTAHWSSCLSGIFEARNLKHLYLESFPKAYADRLSALKNLVRLTILGCGTQSLESLGELSKLQWLRLARMYKLADNEFISRCENLRILQVQNCSGFGSLKPLQKLKHLERVMLSSVGPVDSLKPLRGMANLKAIVLSGARKTCLVDGDLSVRETLPNLTRFSVLGKSGVHWVSDQEDWDWYKLDLLEDL